MRDTIFDLYQYNSKMWESVIESEIFVSDEKTVFSTGRRPKKQRHKTQVCNFIPVKAVSPLESPRLSPSASSPLSDVSDSAVTSDNRRQSSSEDRELSDNVSLVQGKDYSKRMTRRLQAAAAATANQNSETIIQPIYQEGKSPLQSI